MANSKDIKIDGFSVSARGKELLTNTDLTIVHGRRYGLVGPNGMGKTTIMKLLARRKLPVPDFIDILLVEQEVVGDDRSALESVVAADVELQQLRKRKMELEAAMERVAAAEEKGGEEGSAERDAALAEALKACQISEEDDSGMQGKLAMEQKRKEAGEITEETFDLSSELNKTYDRLEEKNDATAEARAAKILHGLGFTVPESKTNVGPGTVQHAQHHQVVLRGLAHAHLFSARAVHRADVFVAGRADEPPRLTSRDLARRILNAVEEDAVGGVARPRLFKLRDDGHHPPARPQAVAVPRVV
jgi:ATPase subunit of ABC transporter with duplicated ATPase domains